MTMLTKLKARNFKCFEDVEIDLGNPVVLVGPNTRARPPSCKPWPCGPLVCNAGRRRVGAPEPGLQTARGHHQAPEPVAPLFPILTQSILWPGWTTLSRRVTTCSGRSDKDANSVPEGLAGAGDGWSEKARANGDVHCEQPIAW